MSVTNHIKQELELHVNKEKREFLPRFFKTGPGEYGEGDVFMGVVVPDQRKVAKKFLSVVRLEDVEELLKSEVHEHRLTGLFILVGRYEEAGKQVKGGNGSDEVPDKNQSTSSFRNDKLTEIMEFYVGHLDRVNNWDLVDTSAHKILGRYWAEFGVDREVLERLWSSEVLWERRVAVVSCFAFVAENKLELPIEVAEKLVNDKDDLMHKAVGWMLREVGKKDIGMLREFLGRHYKTMPRTALRYAIERMSVEERRGWLGR